jgi:hypothetical protein
MALVLEDGVTVNQKRVSVCVNNYLFVRETKRECFALYKQLLDDEAKFHQ